MQIKRQSGLLERVQRVPQLNGISFELDTFCTDLLPQDHPLWDIRNVIITPHVGGMSDIYVDKALSIFEENLKRFLQGERRNLINLVDWQEISSSH